MFNASPNPYVLLSPDTTIVDMNEAYLRVTMRERADIIGRSMFDAFPGPPDEKGRANVVQLRDSLNRVLETRQPDHIPLIQYDIPTPEGRFEERYWSATHTPLFDEKGEVSLILQHTVDVTELHKLRQVARSASQAPGASALIEGDILHRARAVQKVNKALNEERQHLRRLFEQAPGFIAVLSGQDHVFEIANKAYLQMVGDRDIIGKPVQAALPEIAIQGFIQLLDQVYRTRQPFVGRGVRVLLKKHPSAPEEERFLDFVYQPILDSAGSAVGIFVQGNDITEKKQAEDELRQYREHLERLVEERTRALEESEMQRRQAQKLETIGQLTGGVAHDFNNLLAVVIGSIELARRRITDQRADRLLENAFLAAERGARLTKQLLAFARKQSLSLEPTDIPQAIAGMRELLARTIGPSISIQTDLDDSLWTVVTDRDQLEIAILNLAINARDAMPSGGMLTISASNVQPQDRPQDLAEGDYVRIAVRDTGTGIPEELRGKVFEPFFTTKDIGKGTGLGLSQIYGFVKQQGGSVTLESKIGQGTEVALYLPRTLHEPKPGAARRPLANPTGSGAHVLVVDDDPDVRALVVESLRNFGYRVSEAPHGEAGLSLLRERPGIELVLADFAMPVLDGLGFIQVARAEHPRLPIILMTGYADAERLSRSEEHLRNVPLIMKPFNIEALLEVLLRSLGADGNRPAEF